MDSVLKALAFISIPIKSSLTDNKTAKTFKSIVPIRVQEQAITGFTAILTAQVADSIDR